MPKDLTLTMQECVDFMKRHGGRIYRHKGGAWAGPNWKYQGGRCFTAATVKALVTRGVAEYTKKVKGQHGEFAVQAALVPSPPETD